MYQHSQFSRRRIIFSDFFQVSQNSNDRSRIFFKFLEPSLISTRIESSQVLQTKVLLLYNLFQVPLASIFTLKVFPRLKQFFISFNNFFQVPRASILIFYIQIIFKCLKTFAASPQNFFKFDFQCSKNLFHHSRIFPTFITPMIILLKFFSSLSSRGKFVRPRFSFSNFFQDLKNLFHRSSYFFIVDQA